MKHVRVCVYLCLCVSVYIYLYLCARAAQLGGRSEAHPCVCLCLCECLYVSVRAAQLGGRSEARACVCLCLCLCVSVYIYLYLRVLHSWEGELKHVRVKTREDQEGRTLYTFGNEVWKPTIAELVRYFRNHRLYIANENTHLYLDKPVCKPHEKLDEE